MYNDLCEKYSKEKIKELVNNNYDSFYKENEEAILYVIGKDLTDFYNYLTTYYIDLNRDSYGNALGSPFFIKEIPSEEITLEYKFTKVDRVYYEIKYISNTYKLDLNYLWEQIDSLGYPMFYI